MHVAGEEASEFSLDIWVALLAGSNSWTTGERDDAWNRLMAAVQVFTVFVSSCILWWGHGDTVDNSAAVTLIGAVALFLLVLHPALRVIGHPFRSLTVRANLSVRVLLITASFMAVYALLPGWLALWCSPIAIAAGIDAHLTCNELGWRARPAHWFGRFLLSGFHFGVVGALIATIVRGGHSRTAVILPLYAILLTWVALALATLWGASTLHHAHSAERTQAMANVVENERRQSAHWLHDDVCAQLRLVSLRLQTNSVTTEGAVDLLNEFDHQIRLRQLDELFGAGVVRLAEVLQPYIRHAQNHGVEILGVPAFEDASLQLEEPSARLMARTASVLTSNALNAGATAISYRVQTSAGQVHLSIADNGPGLRLADIPHGRGLWALSQDLKPGGLAVEPNPGGGTIVTATIPYTESDHRVLHPARR